MHPPGTPVHTKTYGWRNDAESSHSPSRPTPSSTTGSYLGRKVALAVERQGLVMLSFAVTHNAVADWHHRRRQRVQALAPAA